jgi:hypothetical protein
MTLPFDARRRAAISVRDEAVSRLEEIDTARTLFIKQIADMAEQLGLTDSDAKTFNDHLTNMSADLFYDEERALEHTADNASDMASEMYADYSRNLWESRA